MTKAELIGLSETETAADLHKIISQFPFLSFFKDEKTKRIKRQKY